MFGAITKALTAFANASSAVLIGGGLKMVGQFIIVDTVCNRVSEIVRENNHKKELEMMQEKCNTYREAIELLQSSEKDKPAQE